MIAAMLAVGVLAGLLLGLWVGIQIGRDRLIQDEWERMCARWRHPSKEQP